VLIHTGGCLGDVKPSQLAIAWPPTVGSVPIPGARRVKYREENVEAVEITLTQADLTALDAAAPVGSATGDRYSAGMMETVGH
jgi:aryl-alcohol dehydrogenase-like predicted oxidoreductase